MTRRRAASANAARPARIVGLISGTSADAVDAAVVRVVRDRDRRTRVELEAFVAVPYTASMRARVLGVAGGAAVGAAEIAALDVALGRRFAEAALAAIKAAKVSPDSVDLIGSHGQTVHHAPTGNPPATLQIGDPHVIAERTGIPVVSDFRRRDVAAGGEGAPLVPMAHFDLFADGGRSRAVQNLGGIGNVTVLPAGRRPGDVYAFDTGPANMVIDALVRIFTAGRSRMDRNGAWSRRGEVDESLLRALLRLPFFRRPPPRSTGREYFGRSFVQRLLREGKRRGLAHEDLLATAAELTAASVEDAYLRYVLPRVKIRETLLCGGGVRNPDVVARIRRRLEPCGITVRSSEEAGVVPDAVEAIAFALLAFDAIEGRPGNVPRATGAAGPRVLGSLVAGKRGWPRSLCSPPTRIAGPRRGV